ncbi:CHRD domain-containing protein [Spirosoma arboris]|uniref:CHRD domain-containing protein n=1 Tax=Spirosoma arboris TaxID=2682092 RepID=UPI001D0FF492|nr:CHRD domain-containing protein [Spirosoma arboris]
MKKIRIATGLLLLVILGYACKNDDNPTTVSNPVQLIATLNNQSMSPGSTTSTATGTFLGNLDQSSTVLSYTVTFSGISPTAVTLDPGSTSTSTTSGTVSNSNSILLAGAFPSTISNPGSGTSTSPGSGTSTIPGSGTSTTPGSGTLATPGSGTTTTPGSGTSTTPGSGTLATPGSGTTTTPGSGTSTTPGSGTAIALTSPLSGTVSITQTRADSLKRGLYRVNLRSSSYPAGEIGATVQIR